MHRAGMPTHLRPKPQKGAILMESTTLTKRRASTSLCLTPEETACQLGICKARVYRLLREGSLPHIRVGRRILIPTGSLEDWLRTQAGLICKQPDGGDLHG